jgi:hypothetical protein
VIPSIADFDLTDADECVTIGDLVAKNAALEKRVGYLVETNQTVAGLYNELHKRWLRLRAEHVAVCAERVRLTIAGAKLETELRETIRMHDGLRVRVAELQVVVDEHAGV